MILSEKEKLDHRVTAGDRLFAIWKEVEELLIAQFRSEVINITSFIKGCRKRLGVSRTEIVPIIGVSAKTYASYERGISKIPFINGLLLLKLWSQDY